MSVISNNFIVYVIINKCFVINFTREGSFGISFIKAIVFKQNQFSIFPKIK